MKWLLQPAAWVYGELVRRRNAAFDGDPAACHAAGAPVISVGNITTGGTGKTPLVIAIVRLLGEWGRRPAILTRGYGARSGEQADEVREFAAAIPDVPVVVDADRVRGAAAAIERHGADCLVMDDGFQHRRLRRDLDIVLIDSLAPWGGDALLPLGRLREPLNALARAHAIIVTRSNQVDESQTGAIESRLAGYAPQAQRFRGEVIAERLIGMGERERPIGELSGQTVLAVCGLGNPATVVRLVEQLGPAAVFGLSMRDHHRYGAGDARRIRAEAVRRNCGAVVTTRKDWVKLAPLWGGLGQGGPPLLRLDIAARVIDPSGRFPQLLRKAAGIGP